MIAASIAVVVLAAALVYVLIDRRQERELHAAERRDLLQRIQAPELAIHEHHATKVMELPTSEEADEGDWSEYDAVGSVDTAEDNGGN